MKGKLRGFISIAVIIAILGVAITAFAESRSIEAVFKNIKISINGTQVTNMDVEPFIYDNRTFVPVRFVTDNLGMKVNYNNATDTVEITQNAAPSTPTSGDAYKNEVKEFLYIKDLKEIVDDFQTVSNDYIYKTDTYVAGMQNNFSVPINLNLTVNLYATTQTLYKTVDDRNPNISEILSASDSIITQKQIDDLKYNMDTDIVNINNLISVSNSYSAISNADNKILYNNQNELTLNALQADSITINKYYDQSLSAIKN